MRDPDSGAREQLSQPKTPNSDRARAMRGLPPKFREILPVDGLGNVIRPQILHTPPDDPYGLDQPIPARRTEESQ